jgi:hypothetical protein
MVQNETQIGAKIDKQLWQQFRDNVKQRRGRVRGHLSHELENALREYLNASQGGDTHDRLRRIENQLDSLAEQVDGEESESDSDGERDSVSNRTEQRIADIMSDIQDKSDKYGSKRLPESEIEAAIERNAGTSYKTIKRYKRLLQNQREIFAHPNESDVFFVKPTSFIAFVEQNDNIPEGMRDDIADGLGWEWWEENAPAGMIDDESGKGFE